MLSGRLSQNGESLEIKLANTYQIENFRISDQHLSAFSDEGLNLAYDEANSTLTLSWTGYEPSEPPPFLQGNSLTYNHVFPDGPERVEIIPYDQQNVLEATSSATPELTIVEDTNDANNWSLTIQNFPEDVEYQMIYTEEVGATIDADGNGAEVTWVSGGNGAVTATILKSAVTSEITVVMYNMDNEITTTTKELPAALDPELTIVEGTDPLMWSLILENVPATVDVSTIVTELDDVNRSDVTITWTDVGDSTFTAVVPKASVTTRIGVDFGGDGTLEAFKDLPAQAQSDTVADDSAEPSSAFTVKNVGTSEKTVLEFYFNDYFDSGNPGFESMNAVFEFNSTGAEYVSYKNADGYIGQVNADQAYNGLINVGLISIDPFTDFDKTPILTLEMKDLKVTEDFTLDIKNIRLDGYEINDMTVPVESIVGSTVKTRSGVELSDVKVTIETANGPTTVTYSDNGAISAAISATSDSTMTAHLEYTDEVLVGQTTVFKAIGASDALYALKLSVGLDTGKLQAGDAAAAVYELIAADFNQDGRVSAQDALAILKHSVGFETEAKPQWVFMQDYEDRDYSGFSNANAVPDPHVTIKSDHSNKSVDLVAILVGDVGDSFSASYSGGTTDFV
jgi:hypothetical protein